MLAAVGDVGGHGGEEVQRVENLEVVVRPLDHLAEVPPGGSVTVSGQFAVAGNGVEIAFADTGRDIPPELRDRLFIGQAASRKHLGSGLGLKLVRDAVEAHRGEIAVESAVGQGTTFRIFLPTSGIEPTGGS